MRNKRQKKIGMLLLAAALSLSAFGAASYTSAPSPTPSPTISPIAVTAAPTVSPATVTAAPKISPIAASAAPSESVPQEILTAETTPGTLTPEPEKAEYLNYKFAYALTDGWLGDKLADTAYKECLDRYTSDSDTESLAEQCWSWVYDDVVPDDYSCGAVFLVWSADICGLVDAGTFLRSTDLREIYSHLTEVNGLAAKPLTKTTQFGGTEYYVKRGDVLFWLDQDGTVVNTGIVTLAQGSRVTVAVCNSESRVASFALDSNMKGEPIIKNCNIVPMSYPNNEQLVFLFLVNELGYSNAAASGVMANIYCESLFEPNLEEHRFSEGYGICQWTGARRAALEMWCSGQGMDYSRLSSQLLFMQHELDTSVVGDLDRTMHMLSNTEEDAYKAGYIWCELFENPTGGTVISDQRGKFSRDSFYTAYLGHPFY